MCLCLFLTALLSTSILAFEKRSLSSVQCETRGAAQASKKMAASSGVFLRFGN
ncbi:hypothetical protein BofuT4_uP076390.1 [Botrytis cinerea T4]|uniref:Uncharacterized protein n=1 Tax=Botryotinia fuckeliana (strain T4) TaxID=999810 RepID=G2XNV0_BOTF4|nr:hypothetical protein BofuT4_uP076390.1 [Botrytis cinerea T4]